MVGPHDTEPSAAPTLPVVVGEVLAGKYRVERLIGLGGMAAVVAGTHVELQQPIAVKLLLPERATQPDAVRRFLSEARAAAKLKSEHVARISDVGTTPTSGGPILPYLVMELLEGSDLSTVLEQRGRLPAQEAVDYVLQACDAVAEAHELGIVHRDIKPANLFLSRGRDGAAVLKLLDFGISKTLARTSNPGDRAVTAESEAIGSPGYMSPEQIRGAKNVDHRTDIWSLGVVLQELLTGTDAFNGDNVNDIFVNVLHGPPQAIHARAPDVPDEVCAIVSRCLQKEPDRRFQTIGELMHALQAIAAQPGLVRSAESFRRGVVPVDAGGARPNRAFIVAASVATVIGLALILVAGAARLRARPDSNVLVPVATAAASFGATETAPPSSSSEAPLDIDLPETPNATGGGTRPRASVRPPTGPRSKPTPTGAPAGSRQHRTDW